MATLDLIELPTNTYCCFYNSYYYIIVRPASESAGTAPTAALPHTDGHTPRWPSQRTAAARRSHGGPAAAPAGGPFGRFSAHRLTPQSFRTSSPAGHTHDARWEQWHHKGPQGPDQQPGRGAPPRRRRRDRQVCQPRGEQSGSPGQASSQAASRASGVPTGPTQTGARTRLGGDTRGGIGTGSAAGGQAARLNERSGDGGRLCAAPA